MKIFVLVFVGSFAFCINSQAAIFQSQFDQYPVKNNDCTERAKVIARSLESDPHLHVVKTYCKPSQSINGSQVIVVTYDAATELKMTSAIDKQFGGNYETPSECNDDLPNQARIFKQATGLEPLVAYCTPAKSAQIYAIGVSPKRYYGMAMSLASVLKWPHHDPEIANSQALGQQIATILAAQGMIIARVEVKASYDRLAEIFIYYYAQHPEDRFGITDVIMLPSFTACQKKIPEIKPIVSSTGVVPYLIFCAKERGRADDLSVLYVFGQQASAFVSSSLNDYQLEIPFKQIEPYQYGSLAACQADQSNVEKEEQSLETRRVIGSTCALTLEDQPSGRNGVWPYRVFAFYDKF